MRIQVLIDVDGVTITPERMVETLENLRVAREYWADRYHRLAGIAEEAQLEISRLKQRLAKAEAAEERWEAAQDVLPDEPFNDEWDALSDEGIDLLRKTK